MITLIFVTPETHLLLEIIRGVKATQLQTAFVRAFAVCVFDCELWAESEANTVVLKSFNSFAVSTYFVNNLTLLHNIGI